MLLLGNKSGYRPIHCHISSG